MRDIPDQTLTEISDAIFAGRKIEAIKIYRSITNVGLKEAKDAVEDLEASLRAKAPERFTAGAKGKGCLGAAVIMIGCALLFLHLVRPS